MKIKIFDLFQSFSSLQMKMADKQSKSLYNQNNKRIVRIGNKDYDFEVNFKTFPCFSGFNNCKNILFIITPLECC